MAILARTLAAVIRNVIDRITLKKRLGPADFEKAVTLARSGKLPQAMSIYQSIIDQDTTHLWAITEIGNCLVRLNRTQEASEFFRRALAVDDCFPPALVNLALRYNEDFQSTKAIELLRRARELAPDQPLVDSSIAGTWMTRGDPLLASRYHLSAWLKSFDSHEPAHCYLFCSSYCEQYAAETVAAEHIFWAETLAELPEKPPELEVEPLEGSRKLRVGYISPDFRNHSVRFFVRPLLEGHDRDHTEVYCYYDSVWEDTHTQAIRDAADVFRKTANLPTAELTRILIEDKLDVLIELAGHSSVSRLHVFKHRLATLHVTGLGYPPTTGLSSIDFKFADPRVAPEKFHHLYAERPLLLDESFWCFHPCEPTPDTADPPSLATGHVTFGCFGNASKISPIILECWGKILSRLPNSKLIIKAIAFQDLEATNAMLERIRNADMPADQVQLEMPDPPEELYHSYNRIDIVLDTFPFCGGTTSCFALWMGVPIITLEGSSTSSRMSSSMLQLLGMHECVAQTADQYVEAAVALAGNPRRLAEFRQASRNRMLDCGLSDGRRFASHVERALRQALAPGDARAKPDELIRPTLPLEEMVRRMQFVLQSGNVEAVKRISAYARRCYPMSSIPSVIDAQCLEMANNLEAAEQLLLSALERCIHSTDERDALLINLHRLWLSSGKEQLVLQGPLPLPADSLGKATARHYRIAAQVRTQMEPRPIAGTTAPVDAPFILVVAWVQDNTKFELLCEALRTGLIAGRYRVLQAKSECRVEAMATIELNDADEIILFLDESIEPLATDLHALVLEDLLAYDMVGFAGSESLTGAAWNAGPFESLSGACVVSSSKPGSLDLEIYGPIRSTQVNPCRILAAGLIAVRANVFRTVLFDENMKGTHDLAMLDWVVSANDAGYTMASDSRLLAIRHAPSRKGRSWHEAQLNFMAKHNLIEPEFDVYSHVRATSSSTPLADPSHAAAIVAAFFSSDPQLEIRK